MNGPILPQVNMPKSPSEKVEEAINRATEIYTCSKNVSWVDLEAEGNHEELRLIIEIAKMILQETK